MRKQRNYKKKFWNIKTINQLGTLRIQTKYSIYIYIK